MPKANLKRIKQKQKAIATNGAKGGRPKTVTKQQENENQSANQQNTPQEKRIG